MGVRGPLPDLDGRRRAAADVSVARGVQRSALAGAHGCSLADADALARAGLHADPSLIFEGAYTEQFGISTFSYLLAHADPPTAVFAGNDYIALGLLSAADVHAVSIPHDLSIVGFDDVPFCTYVRPRLTTIQQPVATLALRSVELLVARLENPDAAPQVDVLPVHLVVRDSACALRPE